MGTVKQIDIKIEHIIFTMTWLISQNLIQTLKKIT